MISNLTKLVDVVHAEEIDGWNAENRKVFEGLFGADGGRYRREAEKVVRLRAPEMSGDAGIPFAAYIHEQSATSGAYGGMDLSPIGDDSASEFRRWDSDCRRCRRAAAEFSDGDSA